MSTSRIETLRQLNIKLEETQNANEFVLAWKHVEGIKASFDWCNPSTRELELISQADGIVFCRTEALARIILLKPGWRGVVTMAALLAILPVLVAILTGIVMLIRGLPFLGPALLSLVVVYTAAIGHEFGHWIGMIGWGKPIALYGVMPFSSVRLQFSVYHDKITPGQLAWMYAAGVAGNLTIVILAVFFALGTGAQWLWYVVLANLILAIINSLPFHIWSTDGANLWRIVKHLRSTKKMGGGGLEMNEIPGSYTPRRTLRPWTRSDEGIIVYMLSPTVRAGDSNEITCCRLNRSCAEIWELCNGETEVDKIIDIITERYSVERKEAGEVVKEALLILQEQKCIKLNYNILF